MALRDTPLTPDYAKWLPEGQALTQWYIDRCVDKASYKEMGEKLEQGREDYGVTRSHLRKRGNYDAYGAHVTHSKKKRFVKCARPECGRVFCTDPWLPFGYSPVHNRIVWVAGRNAYYCYTAKCYGSL
jgi:hypothetical protein